MGQDEDEAAPEADISGDTAHEPTLDGPTQARIGDHLRAMYDDLMHQPVPDRFRELLGRLEQRGDGK